VSDTGSPEPLVFLGHPTNSKEQFIIY
jgi:hypothetical protein